MNEETKFKLKVLKYLKSIPNSYVMKLSSSFCSGYPDILFVYNGQAIFFELKTPKGIISKIQFWTIEQLRKAGAIALVVRTLEEVKFIIERR